MLREPGGNRGSIPSNPHGDWIVALPAWGKRCVRVLCEATLPALVSAIRPLPLERLVTIRVYTDKPGTIRETWERLCASGHASLDFHAVPGPDLGFESLSNCHRDALERAGHRDRVVLLTADMVLSAEVLMTCHHRLSSGSQLVCCAPPRSLEEDVPPVGATGRELLGWAWDHRHPMTRECTWPEGTSYDVWRMYFEHEGEVAARVFLPHPLAVMPHGRRLRFQPTIDVNLTSNFSQAVTYMITSPEEGAVIELSPRDKEFVVTESMRTRMATRGPSCPPFVPCTNRRHRYFFGRRVTIRGNGGDCGDQEVIGRMLE